MRSCGDVADDARRSFRSAHPCTDCGETDLRVLDFDHVGKKTANVSELVTRGKPLAMLEAEIASCEVVCANCHRRRTARRAGWARLVHGPAAASMTGRRQRRARNISWVYDRLS